MKAAWTERIAKWGGPTLSSFLLFLAFPPLHLWPMAWVALVPWLIQLYRGDARYSSRSGFCFGFLTGLWQLYFMLHMTAAWTGNIPLSLIPYLLSCAIYGLFHSLLGRLLWRALKADCWWLIPLLWAGWEVARSYLPGFAFPWGLLGTPFYSTPQIAQIAYFGTIYAVTAWAVACNVVFALIVAKQPAKRALKWAAAVLILGIAGAVRTAMPQEGVSTVLTAGQPGVNLAFSSQEEQDRQLSVVVPDLARQAKEQQSRLLILPEGLVIGGDGIPPETSFAVPEDMPVLFGGKRGREPSRQTAFAYDGAWSYADKTRLVPFGEYVPGRNLFPGVVKAFQLPSGDIVPGDKVETVNVAGLKVGALICFEGLFHDVAQAQADNGAQLLAAMCVDDWYFGTPAPEQLMSASVYRAIETGLPVVRAGGLGYTVAVDQRGRIVGQAPLREMAALKIDLKVPEKTTRFPLVRVFPWLALALFAAWLFAGRWLGPARSGESGAVSAEEEPA